MVFISREQRTQLQRLAMGRFATAVATYAPDGKWHEQRTWTHLIDADFTDTYVAIVTAKKPKRGTPYLVTQEGGSFKFSEATASKPRDNKWMPFALDAKMIMSDILAKVRDQQSIYFNAIELNFGGIFNQKIVDEVYEAANKVRKAEGVFSLFIPESALINPKVGSLLPSGRAL